MLLDVVFPITLHSAYSTAYLVEHFSMNLLYESSRRSLSSSNLGRRVQDENSRIQSKIYSVYSCKNRV